MIDQIVLECISCVEMLKLSLRINWLKVMPKLVLKGNVKKVNSKLGLTYSFKNVRKIQTSLNYEI